MGFFGKLLGVQKRQPYVDAGMALLFKLCREFNLPGWKDGLPEYTQEEVDAIDLGLERFQSIADKEMGGKATFHPGVVGKVSVNDNVFSCFAPFPAALGSYSQSSPPWGALLAPALTE